MTITLRPEHQQLIEKAMQTGAYQNADDVIERALKMLQSEDERRQNQRDLIEAKLERAFGQFESGQFLSAEDSRTAMEKRKSEWLFDQQR